jgi:TRAP-type C4-dicarboxylate transport system substrate-binding protein
MPRISRPGLIAAALTAALAVGACGGAHAQRSGGHPAATVKVLTLANGNPLTDELQVFIDQVEKLSQGRLRIKPQNHWRKGELHYEHALVDDVKAGKADLGWVGSRVLASLGVASFEPLHAPFVIDSYELESRLLEGDADEHMLADLERIGLAGVAVLPGPLQYLQLDRKVDGPAGIAGLRIGYTESSLHKAALTALGARPALIPTGGSIAELNGGVGHAILILGNEYVRTARYTVADTPLWPRPFVVFANDDTWTSLPPADRKLLVQAAEQARGGMRSALLEREQLGVAGLCGTNARLIDLGPEGQARMRQAVKPLLAKLRNDPATRDTMAAIAELRRGGSPHGLRCPATAGTATPAVLTGTYETTIRKAEQGSDALDEDWEKSGADALRFRLGFANGRAIIMVDYPSGPIFGSNERYSTFKDLIKLQPATSRAFTARWQLDGNRLRITDVDGAPDEMFVWGRTWIRTG